MSYVPTSKPKALGLFWKKDRNAFGGIKPSHKSVYNFSCKIATRRMPKRLKRHLNEMQNKMVS